MELDRTSNEQHLGRVLPAGVLSGGTPTPKERSLQKFSDKADQNLDPDCIVTEAELADLLGITAGRVRTLTRDGVIRKAAPARYRLREALRGYAGNLRDKVASSGRPIKQEGNDLKAEKLRLAKHQADKIELQNAQLRRELLPAAEVERTWAGVLRDVRAALLAVGTRCGAVLPHLSAHDVLTIDREIKTALEGLADGN